MAELRLESRSSWILFWMPYLPIHSRQVFYFISFFFFQHSSLCFLVPCFGVIISSRKFSWEFFFSSRLKEWRGRKKNHYHRALETSLTITTTKAGFSVGILLTNGVRKTFKHLQPTTPFVNPREETWAKKKKKIGGGRWKKKPPQVSETEKQQNHCL